MDHKDDALVRASAPDEAASESDLSWEAFDAVLELSGAREGSES